MSDSHAAVGDARDKTTSNSDPGSKYTRLLEVLAMLRAFGQITDEERGTLKALVARANEHTLTVLDAAVEVYTAQAQGAQSDAVAELRDTFKVVLESSYMM